MIHGHTNRIWRQPFCKYFLYHKTLKLTKTWSHIMYQTDFTLGYSVGTFINPCQITLTYNYILIYIGILVRVELNNTHRLIFA